MSKREMIRKLYDYLYTKYFLMHTSKEHYVHFKERCINAQSVACGAIAANLLPDCEHATQRQIAQAMRMSDSTVNDRVHRFDVLLDELSFAESVRDWWLEATALILKEIEENQKEVKR